MILWNATLRPNRGCHCVRTFATYVITCSSHGFTNSESTNPELSICYCFCHDIFCFDKKKSDIYCHFLIYFDSQMKIHLEISWKQIRIRRFRMVKESKFKHEVTLTYLDKAKFNDLQI